MAFTIKAKVDLHDPIIPDQKGYFNFEDISILMSQPNAQAVAPFLATITHQDGTIERNVLVLVAVTDINTDPANRQFGRVLEGDNNFVALLCPPFRDQGAVLKTDLKDV